MTVVIQRLVLLAASASACAGGSEGYNVSAPLMGDSGVSVVVVASGLDSPLFVTAPAGDSRLFILERPGRIRIVHDGALLETPFLDITGRVSTGGERGLLGLAFHPAFDENGWFYVNYSDVDGDTRIERYLASAADPNRADPASAHLLLDVHQPYGNHNGGMIAFGPDGMLYIGLGDGGSAGDPHDHGQNPATLLGALLRIDVNRGSPYGIPPDNPFAGSPDGRDEIWAIGVRNPWRFSFDRDGARLFIGDVGQSDWEEIDVVGAAEPGLNFGWNVMEGRHCFRGDCAQRDLTLPVVEYGHDQGCSIIGGYVYRGTALPALVGHYFYSDWCRGWLRSFRIDESGAVTEHTEWPVTTLGNVLSFGEDAEGELYVASQNGSVFRVVQSR